MLSRINWYLWALQLQQFGLGGRCLSSAQRGRSLKPWCVRAVGVREWSVGAGGGFGSARRSTAGRAGQTHRQTGRPVWRLSTLLVDQWRTTPHPYTAVARHRLAQSTGKLYSMVWYGMVNVDLYSTIITKVSDALNTLVSGEKPGFQALSKGLIVLLCSEVVWQGVSDHGAVHSEYVYHTTRTASPTMARSCLPDNLEIRHVPFTVFVWHEARFSKLSKFFLTFR